MPYRLLSVLAGFVAAILLIVPPSWALTLSTADNPIKPGKSNSGFLDKSFNRSGHAGVEAVALSIDRRRSYFIFDLSPVPGTIIGATLRIHGTNTQSRLLEPATYTLFDVSADPTLLHNTIRPFSEFFNDLGSGVSYGSVAFNSTADVGEVTDIQLNPAALLDLNAGIGSGYFAIGGRLSALTGNTTGNGQFLWGLSGFPVPNHELILSIPEPTAPALLATAFASFGWAARRRRQ